MNRSPTAIIIPAYNEAGVIVNNLEHLLREATAGEFEVTVVCNGCKDRTAEVTRQAFNEVKVIELEKASKTAAINAGLRQATSSRVVLLDSDIQISAGNCRALIKALDEPGVEAAIGHMQINDTDCAGTVKAFYRVWITHPHVANGKFAAVFALSSKALRAIGELPEVIADDSYIRSKISSERVARVDFVQFQANVPRNLPTLVRVRSRVRRGNRQLARSLSSYQKESASANRHFASSLLKRPSLWKDIPAYLVVTIAARILALKPSSQWERDCTTR